MEFTMHKEIDLSILSNVDKLLKDVSDIKNYMNELNIKETSEKRNESGCYFIHSINEYFYYEDVFFVSVNFYKNIININLQRCPMYIVGRSSAKGSEEFYKQNKNYYKDSSITIEDNKIKIKNNDIKKLECSYSFLLYIKNKLKHELLNKIDKEEQEKIEDNKIKNYINKNKGEDNNE